MGSGIFSPVYAIRVRMVPLKSQNLQREAPGWYQNCDAEAEGTEKRNK